MLLFGSSTNITAATSATPFSFGSSLTTTAPTSGASPSPFIFGSGSTMSTSTSTPFGSSTGAFGFRSTPAAATTQPSAFAFGLTSTTPITQPSSFTFGSTSTALSTTQPPSFTFGSTSDSLIFDSTKTHALYRIESYYLIQGKTKLIDLSSTQVIGRLTNTVEFLLYTGNFSIFDSISNQLINGKIERSFHVSWIIFY